MAAALTPTTLDIVRRAGKVLAALQEVQLALPEQRRRPPRPTRSPTSARSSAGCSRSGSSPRPARRGLADLTRYVTAIGRRLERLPRDAAGDRDRMQRVHAVEDAYDELVVALSPSRAAAPTSGISRGRSRNCG